ITRPLHSGLPVWPGDPPFELAWAARVDSGDPVNLAELRSGVHAGTHVDAPYHVLDDGRRIDEVSLDVFIGPALVLDVRNRDPVEGGSIEPAFGRDSRPTRLLLRTG